VQRAAAWAVGAVAVWVVAGWLLPNGAPFGVAVLGVVIGGLTSLTAMGLVLVYRSSRIVNFAQAEIGGLAASVAVVMVVGWKLPYLLAVPVGLAASLATGWLIDATVVRRFFTAPRLILTVATIGLAQILGATQIWLPHAFSKLHTTTTFTTPFTFTFRIGPLIFDGDDVVAMCAVPLLLVGLGWFFSRSDTGVAVRAAADSNERALLLGIPVRRLSQVTWMLAAALSGIGSILSAPVLGPNIGTPAGAIRLLAPLAAAVVGRMESLPVTVAASVGIGVFTQTVFWNYPRSSTVDVALFGVVLAALLFQRSRISRVDGSDLGGYVAVREVRPIPTVLRSLPEIRWARVGGWVVLALVGLVFPMALSAPHQILATYIVIYGIIAVSLVVLTGWAGQISLGQFAFVGVGAATTASLLVHARTDFFLALLLSAAAGAGAAVLVGIPALRIPGLFLAVTTLSFAVPVSTFLLSYSHFEILNPIRLNRPVLIERFRLDTPLTFYYVCLVALVVAMVLARNYRRTRAGRAAIAVRDNERGAAAFSIVPVRAKLVAFAFSGALAGVAGSLYAVALRGMPYSGFSPDGSLVVFTMVVIGGIASLPGALLGALYVEGTQYYLHGALQLLATGAGLLVLLMLVPGGLGEVVFGIRDRLLRWIAARRDLSVPSLAETPDFDEPSTELSGEARPIGRASPDSSGSAVTMTNVDASYGHVQVLYDVDLAVDDGEVIALLGTNGAGKSTLLRVLAGLMSAGEGRVVFEGEDITELDPVARVRAGLVMVPGGRGVFGSLTVAENLRMAEWLSRHDHDALADVRRRVFELFPVLEGRLGQRASLLSGGEQQMLTLAQALLCRPRVMLIDELSLGLAPAVVATLADVVRQINADGTTVVLVEQSVNVATTLAHRAVFMEKGQVRFAGPIAELTDRPDLLRSVFLKGATAPKRSARISPSLRRTNPHRSNVDGTLALEVVDVSRNFGGVAALSGVDLEVAPGQILGVIGSNGAGKTTLFDICSGFLTPDSGRILFDGEDVTSSSPVGRSGLGLGRSFQDARLFPSMTVVEALSTAFERHIEVRDPLACIFAVGAAMQSEESVAQRVDELIETMGLTRYRDAFVSELSTGTRRILELASTVAHRPKVVLLDEPSSGIAQRESEALAQVLVDLRARTGAALVVIEHDIPLVSSIAEEMVCLHLGQVIARGKPKAVLDHPEVVASYLGTDDTTIFRSGTKKRARARATTK
jgi:ABC-type branched-subunit amino acid transport system ATPase component/branched-subunit amino acid ABC-type transport system permease component